MEEPQALSRATSITRNTTTRPMIRKGMISSNMLFKTGKKPVQTPAQGVRDGGRTGSEIPFTNFVFPVGDVSTVTGPNPAVTVGWSARNARA